MSTKINSYLSFTLNNEHFAVNVSKVIEILEVPKITKVPKAPEYLKGVINLRGNVLPVIDTRVKFGMLAVENTIDTCVVVIEIDIDDEVLTVGALVDSVKEVIEISEESIKPSPTIGTDYNPEFMEGIVKMDNDFLMILDIGKVFSTHDIILLNTSNQDK
jgi:purine-binding chemotaxis protein CheW